MPIHSVQAGKFSGSVRKKLNFLDRSDFSEEDIKYPFSEVKGMCKKWGFPLSYDKQADNEDNFVLGKEDRGEYYLDIPTFTHDGKRSLPLDFRNLDLTAILNYKKDKSRELENYFERLKVYKMLDAVKVLTEYEDIRDRFSKDEDLIFELTGFSQDQYGEKTLEKATTLIRKMPDYSNNQELIEAIISFLERIKDRDKVRSLL